jgi:predicted Na+-dependent transporter
VWVAARGHGSAQLAELLTGMVMVNATRTISWGDGTAGEPGDDETALGIVTYIMLAGLFFGLAATVEMGQFRSRFKEKKGIVCGLACQFLIVPCLGYASTQIFDLDPIYGVTLIILCSSPGGSYSNWWCSMFNADLALSVAMTTCSTFVAMVMLPINTVLYTKLAYDGEEDVDLDWPALIASLGVTIGGITFGLVMGAKFPAKRSKFNAFGQLSGIGLMIVSAIFSSKKDPIWNREACVSLLVSLLPLVCPLSLATALSQIGCWSGWLAGCGLQELLWCHVPAVRRRDLHLAGRHLAARAAGAAAVATFLAAVLTEICLCNVCSCQEILRRNGRGQSPQRMAVVIETACVRPLAAPPPLSRPLPPCPAALRLPTL